MGQWAKGYSGTSMGTIINTRRKQPSYEKNTDTCKVCWSGKGFPCQTKNGSDMKLTHASLRAGKKKPDAPARKPAPRKPRKPGAGGSKG